MQRVSPGKDVDSKKILTLVPRSEKNKSQEPRGLDSTT